MKKSLLLSAAALATVLGVNAQDAPGVVTYDFNTHGVFADLQEDKTAEDEFDLYAKSDFDFIKNTGAEHWMGEMMQYKNDEGKWIAVTNRVISLVDGMTYLLDANAESNSALAGNEEEVVANASDNGVIPADHPYIGWDQAGVGPSRCHAFLTWGTPDGFVADKDYGAFSEADWVATRGAFAFLRNGNSGSRTATYIQFRSVNLPCIITYYVGAQNDGTGSKKDYNTGGLTSRITPVVDGEVCASFDDKVGDAGAFKAKRMYKRVCKVNGQGKADIQIGCNGNELQLYHVIFDSNYDGKDADLNVETGGVENVVVDDVDAANAPVYNLYGQRVDAKNYKGIVIQNGKKFILK